MTDLLREYLDFHLDVSERIKAFQQRKLYSVELEITNTCNLSCKYCYASANKKKVCLDETVVIKILEAMQREGMKEVGWIGGEPLLVPELFQWMSLASERGLTNVLYTNGLLIDEACARKLIRHCGNGRIVIHLDATDYEHWAEGQLRPSRKKFELNLHALERLVDAGCPGERVIMSTPLTRTCYETLEETLSLFISQGVRFINLIPLTPLGLSNDKNAFLSPEEIWTAMGMRAKALNMPELMGLGISEYCKQFQMTDICVNCEGKVLPYVDYFQSVGNVYEEELDVLVERHFDKLSLADWVTPDTFGNRMRGHCGVCEYKTWCFGNPVSRETVVMGEPDHDCFLVCQDNAKQT